MTLWHSRAQSNWRSLNVEGRTDSEWMSWDWRDRSHWAIWGKRRQKNRKRNPALKARRAKHSWPCNLKPWGTIVFSSENGPNNSTSTTLCVLKGRVEVIHLKILVTRLEWWLSSKQHSCSIMRIKVKGSAFTSCLLPPVPKDPAF